MPEAEHNTEESASAERAEVERLQDEINREHNLYLRALADFEWPLGCQGVPSRKSPVPG